MLRGWRLVLSLILGALVLGAWAGWQWLVVDLPSLETLTANRAIPST